MTTVSGKTGLTTVYKCQDTHQFENQSVVVVCTHVISQLLTS